MARFWIIDDIGGGRYSIHPDYETEFAVAIVIVCLNVAIFLTILAIFLAIQLAWAVLWLLFVGLPRLIAALCRAIARQPLILGPITLILIGGFAALLYFAQPQINSARQSLASMSAGSTVSHSLAQSASPSVPARPAPSMASTYQQGLSDLAAGRQSAAIAAFGQMSDRQGGYGALERTALWQAEKHAVKIGRPVKAMELLSGLVSLGRRDSSQSDMTRASYKLSALIAKHYHPLSGVVARQSWTMAGGGPAHTRYRLLGGLSQSGTGVMVKTVFEGSNDGYLYALDGTTGHILWRFQTGGAIKSDPAVAAGIVYVGSDSGTIYAIDAQSGVLRWSFHTGGAVWAPPAVVQGIVYVGSNDQNVYALNAATGQELWYFTTGGEVGFGTTVVDGVAYVGSYDGNLYALNAATGQELWRYTTGAPIADSPVVTHGVAYIGSNDGTLYALNSQTGGALWQAGLGTAVRTVAVADNSVIAMTKDGMVHALTVATGRERWHFTTGGPTGFELAVSAGMVYFGSSDHYVYAVDARKGYKRWRFETAGPVTASPALADGVLYIGSYDNHIYALNAATGQQLWRVTTLGQVWSSPAVVGV